MTDDPSATQVDTPSEDQPEQPEPERKESLFDLIKELPILIVVAFGLALLIKTFLIQAFFIPSGSMMDTLNEGDRVLVSKLSYWWGEPRYGDVVVFVSPTEPVLPDEDKGALGNFLDWLKEGFGFESSERDFIKRVIAVGGQAVEGKDCKIFIDGEPLDEPYVRGDCATDDFQSLTIDEGEVFVMGDNRPNSHDSRRFGPIKESTIIGRSFILLWPPSNFDWMGRL